MLPFKDISYAQGQWNMDTDSDQVVAMKASGFYTSSKIPYLDTQLVRNYANAIRLNKVPIMYHFCGGADPTAEADYFFEAVSPLAAGDCYALDYEFDVPDPVNWVLVFMTHFHDKTNTWPWLYIDISRLNAHDWSPVLRNCGLWIAAPSFGFEETIPIHNVYIAQQGPTVNGIDTDMFFGTIDELKRYAYTPTAPTPPPTPPVVTPPAPPVIPDPTPPTVPTPTPPVDPVPPVQPPDPVIPPVTPTPPTPTPLPVTTKPLSLWQRIVNWFLSKLHVHVS